MDLRTWTHPTTGETRYYLNAQLPPTRVYAHTTLWLDPAGDLHVNDPESALDADRLAQIEGNLDEARAEVAVIEARHAAFAAEEAARAERIAARQAALDAAYDAVPACEECGRGGGRHRRSCSSFAR